MAGCLGSLAQLGEWHSCLGGCYLGALVDRDLVKNVTHGLDIRGCRQTGKGRWITGIGACVDQSDGRIFVEEDMNPIDVRQCPRNIERSS